MKLFDALVLIGIVLALMGLHLVIGLLFFLGFAVLFL